MVSKLLILKLPISMILLVLVGSANSLPSHSTLAQNDPHTTHDCTNGIFAGMDGTETGEPYPTILTSTALERAVTVVDPTNNQWQIAFGLTDEGSDIFYEYTNTHIGQQVAIVLDGQVLTAPTIQAAIRDDGIITGDFNAAEAQVLASQLQSGPLPLKLIILELTSSASVRNQVITRIHFGIVLADGIAIENVSLFLIRDTVDVLKERLNLQGYNTHTIHVVEDGIIELKIRSDKDISDITDTLLVPSLLEFVDYSVASYRPEAGECILTEGQLTYQQQQSSGQPVTNSG